MGIFAEIFFSLENTVYGDALDISIISKQELHSSLPPTYILLNDEFSMEIGYLWVWFTFFTSAFNVFSFTCFLRVILIFPWEISGLLFIASASHFSLSRQACFNFHASIIKEKSSTKSSAKTHSGDLPFITCFQQSNISFSITALSLTSSTPHYSSSSCLLNILN